MVSVSCSVLASGLCKAEKRNLHYEIFPSQHFPLFLHARCSLRTCIVLNTAWPSGESELSCLGIIIGNFFLVFSVHLVNQNIPKFKSGPLQQTAAAVW